MRAQIGWAMLGNLRLPCAIGRAGRRALKREGDGATPVGRFHVRYGYFRADRLQHPRTRVPLCPLRINDGWCDAVGDRNYNRRVTHPYPASAERMWREDHLYDLVIVLDHNERPRVQGAGSAVFVHVARPGYRPTAGCIALERRHLIRALAWLRAGTNVHIDPWPDRPRRGNGEGRKKGPRHTRRALE
jgi:L,D-peptidoglycan transpeptidase YkuD (ErfK/YbiS/YcfS/YnhG family)